MAQLVKNLPAGDLGLIPVLGRSPGEENDCLLQYCGLENSWGCQKSDMTEPLSLHSLLNGPTLTVLHDYWKNHSCDYMDFCWQHDVSAF